MPSTADIMLQQAQALIKAGRRADARPMLEQIVNADDQNEQAWLWLSACVESLEEQRICLENVLMLNPGNQKAIKGLETIRQKLSNNTSASKPQMPQMPLNSRPAAPANDPYSPYSPSGNDVFGSPYESGTFQQPPADDGWAPATSVDWGRGNGPAYGSGKKINEPTASEFDSWVAKLPLDGKKPPEPPPPQMIPRRTSDIPPMPVTSTDDQFNIPSSYNAGDDPFRGNFDFNDFPPSAPSAPAPVNKSVSPFGMANDNAAPAAPQGQGDFDFSGFDGPFSSGSSGTSDAYTYDEPPQTQAASRQTTNDDWGDFGTPSFAQNDSAAAFNVPGGFNDADADDAYARRSSSKTSAERFQFGERRAPSGTQGRRSQLPNLESAEGMFADDGGAPDDFPAPDGVDFSDADDMLTSSGIFGAAKRTSEGAGSGNINAKGNTNAKSKTPATPTYAPSIGAFKAIPPEIQVKSGSGSGKTVLAIVGLLILNAASIAVLLLVNLRNMGMF